MLSRLSTTILRRSSFPAMLSSSSGAAVGGRKQSITTMRMMIPSPTTAIMGSASTRAADGGSRMSVTTVAEATAAATADDALRDSGYSAIDFTIQEEVTVYEAVKKFAAFNIGCLVTTDSAGNMTGVVSERDYISKIALLGKTSQETLVKEISTRGHQIVTASANESVESCMEKMLSKGIRHLPILDAKDEVIGLVSIKDLVRTIVRDREETIKVLSDFALGKGGHFGSD